MSKPLDGVRVLDVTRMLVGPTTTMLLADMGADVIKVEPPAGDDNRYMQSTYDPENCPFFLAVNRNKRDIVTDLATPEGLDIFYRLVKWADVVVHNFRPGIVEKLKIDYPAVCAVKSDIIYCSISAFGETGPYARRPGTDVLFQAMAGLMSVSGEPEGRPLRAAAPVIDVTTGLSAAYAIVCALMQRQKTGKGDKIELCLYNQTIFMQSPMYSWSLKEGKNPPRLGNKSPLALILDVFTSDGYIMIAIPNNKFWHKLCDMINIPELSDDPRFRTISLRLEHQNTLYEVVAERFKTDSTAVWMEKLMAAGLPCGDVRTYQQVLQDPQLKHNGMFMDLNHPVAGDIRVVSLPFKMAGVPVTIERVPPLLGQDTTEVLRDLGYAEAEITSMFNKGVTKPAYSEE